MTISKFRIISILIAGAVAWWSKSAVMTIVVGMIALWLLRYVGVSG